MPRKSSRSHRKATSSEIVPTTEWVGGVLRVPSDALEEMWVVLWLVEGRIASADIVERDDPHRALERGLESALAIEGIPLPSSVRVADTECAAAVRTVLAESVPVTVAPTPELEPFAEDLARTMAHAAGEDLGLDLVALGDDEPDLVRDLFAAGAALERAKPWALAPSGAIVVGLDAPALGWTEACAVASKLEDGPPSLLLFASFGEYGAHVLAMQAAMRAGIEPGPTGVPYLVVEFERLDDLADGAREAIADRGWDVADGAAPVVTYVGKDGEALVLQADDARHATAACEALARFATEHGGAIAGDPQAPREGRYALERAPGLEVTVRFPHPEAVRAAPMVDEEESASREVVEPWKTTPNARDAPGEGVKTVVLSSGRVAGATTEAEARGSVVQSVERMLRAQLDRAIPAMGGVPRELVKSDEGRAKVAKWLRDAEALGLPEGAGRGRWLDLDGLREELGIATVASGLGG